MTKILVKGDISGIQDFIFNVKSKGAAQELKGRSFFLKILLEVSMEKIFDELGIISNDEKNKTKISTSGGNFVLLLSTNNPEKIDEIQLAMSQAISYTGLNIMLSYVEYDEDNYNKCLKLLNQRIRQRKYSVLMGDNSFFEPFEREDIYSIHYERKSNKDNKSKWEDITLQIKRKSHFIIEKIDNKDEKFRINGNSLEFAGYRVSFVKLSDSKELTNEIDLGIYLESIFPKGKNFEDLANWGGDRGIRKLGILTLDVDSLGVKIENVKGKKEHENFDDKLKKFFNRELKKLITSSIFQGNVYVVTAGGDDSFFVGKWNTMLDLAIEINKAFMKYFSNELTISAALVIVDPKFPLIRFAQMAEDALKDAKYKYESKGNISLLGEVLKWDILIDNINPLRKKEFSRGSKSILTSGILAKARLTALSSIDDEGLRLLDFWKMGYYMRGYNKDVATSILKKHREFLVISNRKHGLIKRNYRLIFPMAARLAELDKR